MACSNRNCSRCGCRCGGHARVNYPDTSTCADRRRNCGCNSSCSGCRSGCGSSNCSGCSSCGSNCGAYPPWRPWLQDGTTAAAAANAANAINVANGFGLLRTVPDYASYRRCWQDGPFYNGPCGPCEGDCGCGCNHGCHHGCYPPPMPPLPPAPEPQPTVCPNNATFIAGTPVNLAAGDNITLSSISTDTEGFIPTTSGIRIQNAGTYMVTYTIQIPAGEDVATRFQLTLDGGNIPSSAVDVNVAAADGTTSYTMHAIIQANDNSLLNLTTQAALAIAATATANLVTLSIVQIC